MNRFSFIMWAREKTLRLALDGKVSKCQSLQFRGSSPPLPESTATHTLRLMRPGPTLWVLSVFIKFGQVFRSLITMSLRVRQGRDIKLNKTASSCTAYDRLCPATPNAPFLVTLREI
jgi:hypothetical protein